MTATALRTPGFASSRTVASRPAKSAGSSLWALLSQSLEMAHIVGEQGPVSTTQMEQIRSLAARL
ncbi:hypothetical protein [Lacisediminimonas profundi]|uniref:hypothetical protein n=1 Tax=Lacisediminimonas profundi TaxID=2603856 RepID=UPI00124B08A3|nr:hypothetical protein [Lacisediminimonas profundi]